MFQITYRRPHESLRVLIYYTDDPESHKYYYYFYNYINYEKLTGPYNGLRIVFCTNYETGNYYSILL